MVVLRLTGGLAGLLRLVHGESEVAPLGVAEQLGRSRANQNSMPCSWQTMASNRARRAAILSDFTVSLLPFMWVNGGSSHDRIGCETRTILLAPTKWSFGSDACPRRGLR